MEEDDRYHYPNDQRAYNFALRHLDHKNPSEVVGLYRDADAFFNSRSGDVKKQYEKDLRELDFDALKQRTPSLANEKDRKSDKEVLHEDDRWRVVVPLSHKSMRGEGTDTKWCVSTENPGHACTYRKDDNLHIFVIDKPKAQGGQDAYGKYALTSKGFEGKTDVRNTYDRTGPGHRESLKKAFPAVAEKMGLPDDIRDQVLKTYEEKYPELDARMKGYPRDIESQNIYRGLNADILYGNLLDTASPQELRSLSSSGLSPDAKALLRLKRSNAPLRAEIDPQSIPKQLLKALQPSKAPSHLTPDQVAKAFEISPKQAKEALGIVQKALGDSSDRSHASAKKQKKQENSFKRWLDGRYEGIGIQNPNPGLKDPIDPDTLLTYAGDSDYKFQRNAIKTKKQLWYQWWKESEEKRKAETFKLRDQIWAYKPRNTHPDAKIEKPQNIEPDALVDKDAVVSGYARVKDNATVSGGEISGGTVGDNAQVSGGEISGGQVSGRAHVSGGKISGTAQVGGDAQVTGGAISGGSFGGDCKIRGGNWDEKTLKVMQSMPEYGKHLNHGRLISGEWDDVPDDVKKKLETFGPTGKHPDAKIENPMYIGPKVLIGKDAEVDGLAQVFGNAVVSDLGVVSDNATVQDHAVVSGNARVGGSAHVYGNARVGGRAEVKGRAHVYGKAKVSGGEISGGTVEGNAQVSGGEISENAKVWGSAEVSGDAKISGRAQVGGDAEVTGGTISGGLFAGDCKIHGGYWSQATLRLMSKMPKYGEHFDLGQLISGEWDDVPDDVKKKLEPFGPTGKHPDAKIEKPQNIEPGVLVGKDAVISGNSHVWGNAVVSGGEISGGRVYDNAWVSGDAKISGDGSVSGNAKVSGGEIIRGSVYGKAQVTGGKISGKAQVLGNAQVSGGEISGDAWVRGDAVVTGGTISGGSFAGKCKIRGGNWDEKTLQIMSKMPKYEKHFEEGGLISGEWDDVPEDVKKKLEEENAR
jgi:UDP-3-O-[3-hydroxymyristoyl] glucosamine N-acyltransferase